VPSSWSAVRGHPAALAPDAGSPDAGIGRPTTARITVRPEGAATGVIAAAGLRLTCADTDCTAIVPIGTTVTLVATPDPGAVFAGWRGGCAGSEPTYSITAIADIAVAGRFDVATFPLIVELAGSGAGIITSTSGVVTCPDTCTTSIEAKASAPAQPKRTIRGGNTRMNGPRGILAFDDVIWIANSVSMFARRATGDVAPSREISGNTTGLASPDQLAVFGDEIYVMNTNSGVVSVFARDQRGDVAPSRTISGFDALAGIAVF